MKKIIIILSAIVVVAIIAIVVAVFNKADDVKLEVKLLEFITTGNYTVQFKYDDKNRIIEIKESYDDEIAYTGTFTYSGNDLTYSFVSEGTEISVKKNGDKISVHEDYPNGSEHRTITVNNGGYITKIETESNWEVDFDPNFRLSVETFQYTADNLTKVTKNVADRVNVWEYKYDDKNSPFYHCKTPKWVLQYLFRGRGIGVNNNVVESRIISDGERSAVAAYKYEYNSDGFPTKQIKTELNNNETTTFTYIGETKTPVAKDVKKQPDIAVLTPSEIVEFGSHVPPTSPFNSEAFFHFNDFVVAFRDGKTEWAFGEYEEEFTASSALRPHRDINYSAENLRNEKYRAGGWRSAAWCEGVNGVGIGEWVNMRVKILSHVTERYDVIHFPALMIVNGYAKDQTAWKNNSRVKILRLSIGGKPWCDLHLGDIIKPQIFRFPDHLRIYPKKSGTSIPSKEYGNQYGYQLDMTFEVIEVYPGEKFDDTCITGIALDIYGGIDIE